LSFFRSSFSERQKPAKPGVCSTVSRPCDKSLSIVKYEFHTDDESKVDGCGSLMHPNDASERINVGDADGAIAEFRCTVHKLVGV
jgi:hypothetical protein